VTNKKEIPQLTYQQDPHRVICLKHRIFYSQNIIKRRILTVPKRTITRRSIQFNQIGVGLAKSPIIRK